MAHPDLGALRTALKEKERQLRAVEATLARELERGIALRLELAQERRKTQEARLGEAQARALLRRLHTATEDETTIPATRTQTDETVKEGTPARTPKRPPTQR